MPLIAHFKTIQTRIAFLRHVFSVFQLFMHILIINVSPYQNLPDSYQKPAVLLLAHFEKSLTAIGTPYSQ